MSFRRPQKTPLQRALREAERTVSGALFLLLEPPGPEAKADLRARFVAGLCAILIVQRQLTARQVQNQLNPSQLKIFNSLPPDQAPSPEALWGRLPGRETAASLGTWLELGSRYVAGQLRGEEEPESVDWGRREQEMTELFSSFQGATELDFPGGLLKIVHRGTVSAQAQMEVIGTYHRDSRSFLAGWADPQVPKASRPLPVFGCASQLFRLDLVHARSEAQRTARLGRMRYLYEHQDPDRCLFLGLQKLDAVGSSAAFSLADFQPEMQTRIEIILKAAEHLKPERLKGLINSKSQEVQRLVPLVQSEPSLRRHLQETADTLQSLAQEIDTHLILGLGRSTISGRDKERLGEKLAKLREAWTKP